MSRPHAGLFGGVILLGMVACTGPAPGGERRRTPAPRPSVPPLDTIDLPEPQRRGDLSFEETLATRRSVRAFTPEPVSLEELSQLLWAAQGITADWGGRTAPSPGALFSPEVYAATPDGLYHYLPEGHRAEVRSNADLRAELAAAALGQDCVSGAPLVLAIAAVVSRTAAKYGDRAGRYVTLEAGHIAQNVLLQAVALDLAAVPVGAFDDGQVARVLALPPGEDPLYLIPVGHPGN